MKYEINHLWETGSRPRNEDSIGIMQLEINRTPVIFAAVADGIGGLSKGEDASGILINSLRCAFEEATNSQATCNLQFIKRRFNREFYSVHRTLLAYGKESNIRLGTTCSLICIIGSKGFILHIGDSRIYISEKRTNNLNQITHDDINSSKQLLKCIGHGSFNSPAYIPFKLNPDSVILLASDGFYKRLNNEIISIPSFLKADSGSDCLRYLNSLSRHRGEGDNSSAILIYGGKSHE